MGLIDKVSRIFGRSRYTPREFGAVLGEQRGQAYLDESGAIADKIAAIKRLGSPLTSEELRRELICFCCFIDWTALMVHPDLASRHEILEPAVNSYIDRVGRHVYGAGLWTIRRTLTVEGMGPPEGGFHNQFFERSEAYLDTFSETGPEVGSFREVAGRCSAALSFEGAVADEAIKELLELSKWFVESNWTLIEKVDITT